jgi:NAD(P)-dependent dehydrogenase (short-subunit alcohol dehydrogenase family)
MNTQPVYIKLNLSRQALRGRVAVVTGAGRGIGRETARALAWLGARVVIAELAENGRETQELICAEGGEAMFVQTDVSLEKDVLRLADMTRRGFGPADILINNAILIPAVPVVNMETALWDRVIGVNLRGTFLTCKAFLPDMLSRRCGTIVNLISTDAMPGLAAYIASKQGITGFSQSLALEVGEQGVRVIAFAPGMVDTPGIRDVAPAVAPRLGMSATQFLNVSLHAGYSGLMPADHAGAATAYLVAALADEYAGETVDGYTVLERAGLLRPATVPVATPAARPRVNGKGNEEAVGDALLLSRKLETMLAETEEEFDHLPLFARPIARLGFKTRTGKGIQDWLRAAAGLRNALEQQRHGQTAELPRLAGQLSHLAAYYEEVPKETARFTNDEVLLRQVAYTSAERVAHIHALQQALAGIPETAGVFETSAV